MKSFNLLLIASLAGSLQSASPWSTYNKNQCCTLQHDNIESYFRCLIKFAVRSLHASNKNSKFNKQTLTEVNKYYKDLIKTESGRNSLFEKFKTYRQRDIDAKDTCQKFTSKFNVQNVRDQFMSIVLADDRKNKQEAALIERTPDYFKKSYFHYDYQCRDNCESDKTNYAKCLIGQSLLGLFYEHNNIKLGSVTEAQLQKFKADIKSDETLLNEWLEFTLAYHGTYTCYPDLDESFLRSLMQDKLK